jgi:YgiT-type zinc finger domain-containing protein
MNQKCHFCGNKNFKKNNVEYIFKKNSRLLIVSDVPCEVCEFCGEQYFKATTLKKIEEEFQDIYVSGKKAKKELRVPVEEYANL